MAEAAFEVFSRSVTAWTLADAIDALELLSARYPVVALSNGNACVHRIGIGHRFCAAVSAREIGCGKPDRRIFLAGAAAAGVPPEAVCMWGTTRNSTAAGRSTPGCNSPGSIARAWLGPIRRAGHTPS